jgi:ADP-L-glycero-D-manno-heptose 6-epimerase
VILVTGGAGFIGSVLVEQLNERGNDNIIIVDRLGTDEKWRNLQGKKFEEYIHADQLFLEENEPMLGDLKAIFHMGACSSTTERNVDFLMDNNVYYSRALFQLATDLDIPFIYASSAATYGDGNLGYDDDHAGIPNFRPLNAYGYSKQLFDEFVLREEKRPSHWFGVKFFNVFGPNEYHKDDMSSLVFKGYHQIKDKGQVKLFKSHKEGYKDGEQLRDFVYVKDVVKAMIEMAQPEVADKSGIYNMGTGQANSFKSLIEATFKAMGKEPNIEYIDMPESIRDQYQYYTQANMAKFSDIFPDFKFHSLEDAVADYVQNHLSQPNPFC